MQDAVTDTHGLIWYLANSARLGANASRLFDACDQGQITLFIPSICLVEMIFCKKKGGFPSNSRRGLMWNYKMVGVALLLCP